MFRKRIPAMDDRTIYALIAKELLPFARSTVPELRLTRRGVTSRLNRGVTRVAQERLGKPVAGFITFFREEKKLFIDMLVVRRSAQGRGLGKRLMALAERYGRRRRCEEALLFVDEENARAQGFYLKMGYRVQSFDPQIRCYLLSKSLA